MGYRTSIRVSTRATPFSLVCGSEGVLPIEVEIQSLKVLVEAKVLKEDWAKARYEQLVLIDEKKARTQYLKEGDLVLKVLRDETFDPRGKMKPKWSRPFIIKKIMSRSATKIINLDGKEMLHPINMDRLRKYHI